MRSIVCKFFLWEKKNGEHVIIQSYRCSVFKMYFILGLEDGQVRALNTKTNKSQQLYGTQSMVVSLASNERGTGFVCGHDDGSIIRYFFESSGAQPPGRIIQHQTTPVALAWANDYIIAAGCDRRIIFYDSQVSVSQTKLIFGTFF